MAPCAHRRPVVLGLEVDRGRHREVGRTGRVFPASGAARGTPRRRPSPRRRRAGRSAAARPGARRGSPSPSARTATCGSCRRTRRRRAPRDRDRSGPGACAPSTIESTPASRARRQIAATSFTRPLVHSTCEQKTTRVRGPGTSVVEAADARASHRCARATYSQRDLMPPYSRVADQHLVAGASSSERATAFTRRARVRREGEVRPGSPRRTPPALGVPRPGAPGAAVRARGTRRAAARARAGSR